MQTDNKTLVDIVDRTFALAVDPDLSGAQRQQYLNQGFALRARLMTLLTAQFADGTQAVVAANAKIKEVNKLLKQKLKDLQGIADTVGALVQLVSVIDDLFQLPFTFK